MKFDIKDLTKRAFQDLENSESIERMAEERLARSRARRLSVDIPDNFVFDMYWMGRKAGDLIFTGDFWKFRKARDVKVAISEGQEGLEQSNVPFFVESLMPEAWTSFGAACGTDDGFDPNCGDRYLSNIVIRPSHRKTPIIVDAITARLSSHIKAGAVFAGAVGECFIPTEEERRRCSLRAFSQNSAYAEMINDINAPKMSGVQDKLPAYLSADGVLTEVRGNAFTHILKFPQSFKGESSTMGSMEWFSLSLAKRLALPIEDYALVDIPGFGPVLAVERFDVLHAGMARSAILAEDMCSVLSLRRSDKARSDMKHVMEAVLRCSTSPDQDAQILMQQIIFSWVIGNDDLHLKNISLLKICDERMHKVKSVRLSPIYDVMTTRAYINQEVPALPILNRYDYDLELFCDLGAIAGLARSEIISMASSIADGVIENTPEVLQNLPSIILKHPESIAHLDETASWILAESSRANRLLTEVRDARKRLKSTFA